MPGTGVRIAHVWKFLDGEVSTKGDGVAEMQVKILKSSGPGPQTQCTTLSSPTQSAKNHVSPITAWTKRKLTPVHLEAQMGRRDEKRVTSRMPKTKQLPPTVGHVPPAALPTSDTERWDPQVPVGRTATE